MAYVSPNKIKSMVGKRYGTFLKRWIAGEDRYFPLTLLGENSKLLKCDPKNFQSTVATSEALDANSKTATGKGYTVRRTQKASRDLGTNSFPTAIEIETLDDFLHLAGKSKEFANTQRVASRVREVFPQLEEWLVSHVKTVWKHAEVIDGLVEVAQHFVENPQPDCYARQIPVSVPTKFIEENHRVLADWLNVLLPTTQYNAGEANFSRRFGLRDDEARRRIRLLDYDLQSELNLRFDDLSLPVRSIAELEVKHATIFIVENRLNLLTLPPFARGLGIRGEGKAISQLEDIPWLPAQRVIYWGDIDVAGFGILSQLRSFVPLAESMMMDRQTLEAHDPQSRCYSDPKVPANLTGSEKEALEICIEKNLWLEQEKIPQAYVEEVISQRK